MAEPAPIYLDHAASTPCDPRVVEAMLPYFSTHYGNPHSRSHAFGREAAAAVEAAREEAAALIAGHPADIVFTAGASESNNLAIKGAARAAERAAPGRPGRGHIVTTAIEHPAVGNPVRRLERDGFDVTFVAPPADGVVTAACIAGALRDDTILVSAIWANNEIGTLAEVPAIGRLCRERGILFHTDATQMIGMMPVDVDADGIDLLSLSGHKICGPKGAGALYARSRDPVVALEPLIEGGGHERGLRAGTLNVPGIVGLGAACGICRREMTEEAARVGGLRDRLEGALLARIAGTRINGDPERRAPHIASVCFGGLASIPFIRHVRGVACSSGAAVSTGSIRPSAVLTAIGVAPELAVTVLRLSLGRSTTEGDVDRAVDRIAEAAERAAGGVAGDSSSVSLMDADPG
jgi:cysteine desulfurase